MQEKKKKWIFKKMQLNDDDVMAIVVHFIFRSMIILYIFLSSSLHFNIPSRQLSAAI